MIEYPSIINSSKAPRKSCIAFDKLDGSNIRVKYTQKQGFCLFGSRTQLIDENHPHLGKVIGIFKRDFEQKLVQMIKKEFPNYREIIVFGEFFGEQSFAGIHNVDDPTLQFVLFDIILGHKQRKFVKPKDLIKLSEKYNFKIPKVIYEGNLNDEFIQNVRLNKFGLKEGVVCKGNETSGAFCGNVWMAKIKTLEYLEKLKLKGFDLKTYGE